MITPGEKIAIDVIKQLVVELEGVSVEKMIVFGSRVHGYASEDSDLDIAIVVSTEEDRKKLIRHLEDKIDYLAMDVLIHPLVITREQYKHKRLGREMEKGIVVV